MRTLEFPARSVIVAYASIHSGYTYTVSDLEPNSVYDVQLSAYYEMTLDMESNWETTSCYTQMQSKLHIQYRLCYDSEYAMLVIPRPGILHCDTRKAFVDDKFQKRN